jgi:hypothetical protein
MTQVSTKVMGTMSPQKIINMVPKVKMKERMNEKNGTKAQQRNEGKKKTGKKKDRQRNEEKKKTGKKDRQRHERRKRKTGTKKDRQRKE